MENFQLLLDFLEGDIDNNKEEELFSGLMNNQSLRNQLKKLYTLNTTIKDNTKYFTPSVKSTMNIFNTLGFSVPVSNISHNYDNAGILGKPLKFLNTYTQFITGLLVSACLFTVVFTYSNYINKKGFNGNIIEKSDNQYPLQMQNSLGAITNHDSIKANSTVQKPQIITKVVYKYIDKPNKETKNISISNTDELKQDENAQLQASNFKVLKMDSNPVKTIIPDYNNIHYSYDVINIPVTLELTGSQYWLFQKAQVPLNDNPKFNNSAIALLYRQSDNLYFGAEMRLESFYQEFQTNPNGSKTILSQQIPNLYYGGAILRYYFDEFSSFYPFAQIGIGGNKAGLVGRLGSGLTFKPYPDINFVFGIEYSYFNYFSSNNSFYSNKIGLNYGVSYNFR